MNSLAPWAIHFKPIPCEEDKAPGQAEPHVLYPGDAAKNEYMLLHQPLKSLLEGILSDDVFYVFKARTASDMSEIKKVAQTIMEGAPSSKAQSWTSQDFYYDLQQELQNLCNIIEDEKHETMTSLQQRYCCNDPSPATSVPPKRGIPKFANRRPLNSTPSTLKR